VFEEDDSMSVEQETLGVGLEKRPRKEKFYRFWKKSKILKEVTKPIGSIPSGGLNMRGKKVLGCANYFG